jgi:hypothetical protein
VVGPHNTLVAGIRALGLALVIGTAHLPSTVGAQQSEQRVSPQEARVLANRLTSIGQPSAAREIALGLLRADATDVTALVALARAEMALSQIDAAERAAQAALSQARTPSEKFMASLVVADVFAQSERFFAVPVLAAPRYSNRAQPAKRTGRHQRLSTSPSRECVGC